MATRSLDTATLTLVHPAITRQNKILLNNTITSPACINTTHTHPVGLSITKYLSPTVQLQKHKKNMNQNQKRPTSRPPPRRQDTPWTGPNSGPSGDRRQRGIATESIPEDVATMTPLTTPQPDPNPAPASSTLTGTTIIEDVAYPTQNPTGTICVTVSTPPQSCPASPLSQSSPLRSSQDINEESDDVPPSQPEPEPEAEAARSGRSDLLAPLEGARTSLRKEMTTLQPE
ncbi:hypothetical protein BDN72DRAFT_959527 [Pluteus cervinus]|uniref:Uncharacterized protein n=1 Tax=Pluteus cervinus TaxID=181527 RepID=A0ACD3AUN3_9AGAR|nr:hypothetical protein BDN72DRAFT_959527 [Pluteus cervinus]